MAMINLPYGYAEFDSRRFGGVYSCNLGEIILFKAGTTVSEAIIENPRALIVGYGTIMLASLIPDRR